MRWRIHYTPDARADLTRLYRFLLDKDLVAAEYALASIIKTVNTLADFPLAGRKSSGSDENLRQLVIPFGRSGYLALYHLQTGNTVVILAIRHQREDDYR